MDRSALYMTTDPPKRSAVIGKNVLTALSILLGLLCLGGFVFTSIHWNINSSIEKQCREDKKQELIPCFISSLISEASRTQWNRYVLSSLLLTYASVLFQMIVETSRTNVSGLLGQTILLTMCIIFGIGVAFPILFFSSYLHFYGLKRHATKSPVPIDVIFIAFIYVICAIVIPTYLVSFLSHEKLVLTIMSTVLLASPLAFALVSLPFRLISGRMQRCWIVNSHRLILQCQIILFVLSSPLFFITLVALIQHWSANLFEKSYLTERSGAINPVAIIWSVDYTALLLGLGLFVGINEYLFRNDDNTELSQSVKIRQIIGYSIFAIIFISAPCLAFPLYVAWKEHQYLNRM